MTKAQTILAPVLLALGAAFGLLAIVTLDGRAPLFAFLGFAFIVGGLAAADTTGRKA